MPNHRLHVVGVSPGAPPSSGLCGVLNSCGVLFAAPRLQKHLGFFRGPVLGLSPFRQALSDMRKYLEQADVGVVVGGDPLFFGIGKRLSTEFGAAQMDVYPALTSMQVAFSRLRRPWDNVHFTSLHGRSTGSLASQILPYHRICLLTGGANTPRAIAERLLQEGISGYRIWVFEDIGEADETITEGNLEEISRSDFSEMSLLVFEREESAPSHIPFGLTETEIVHSRGLITKDEVRAAVLHSLRLPATGVFWDIGAGSGSISLEASRLCPNLDIRTVETNPLQLENIRANLQRFGPGSITLVEGTAPEACDGLPAPDRVFVGGSGGRLDEILRTCTTCLEPGGRIVITAVTESTERRAPTILLEYGLQVSSSRITVERKHWTSRGEETTKLNPISLIAGTK